MYKSDGAPNYIKLCFEVGLAKRSPRFLGRFDNLMVYIFMILRPMRHASVAQW